MKLTEKQIQEIKNKKITSGFIVFYDEVNDTSSEEYWKLNLSDNTCEFAGLYVDGIKNNHFCCDYDCNNPAHFEFDHDYYEFSLTVPADQNPVITG